MSQETQEEPGRSVNRVFQDLLVLWGSQEFQVKRETEAVSGLRDLQERREHWVTMVIPDHQVFLALQDPRVCLDHVGL